MRFLCFFFIALLSCWQGSATPLNYETYLESWDASYQTAYQGLPPGPGGTVATAYDGVVLNICFCDYLFTGTGASKISGTQFNASNTDQDAEITPIVTYIHGKGGKVKVSFGGASYIHAGYFITQLPGWPGNINTLAADIATVVTTLNLDGVDFDIEDSQPTGQTPQETAADLTTFLKAVRKAIGASKTISLTIPAQGWSRYWQYLAQSTATTVDTINFMEYDIWINPGLAQGYSAQIAADVITYTASTTTAPAPNNSPGWGLPHAKVQIGLMPGNDDQANLLTPDDAKTVAQYAVNNSLFGVMTWDIDRDANTSKTPAPFITYPNYTFTNAIRAIVEPANSDAVAHSHRQANNRFSFFQGQFVEQQVPPHGAP